jgi:CheY-like chemotaxis protein
LQLLVVDDDPVFREELSDLLENDGHGVGRAGSALEAASKVVPGRWDAVLTDLRMPKYSGFDLVKDIRRRAPSTYCVIVTGQGDDATERQSFEAGALHFLAKPFGLRQLEETLGVVRAASEFRGRLRPSVDQATLAKSLGDPAASPVVWLSEGPVPPGLAWDRLELDPQNPWAALPGAGRFAREFPGGTVILEVGRGLLEGIGPSPTVAFLGRMRSLLPRESAIRLAIDGPSLTDEALIQLRWALTEGAPPPGLPAMVVPARRRLLSELFELGVDGAVPEPTGTGADRSAGLHRECLIEVGLIERDGSPAALTAEGRDVARFLAEFGTGAAPAFLLFSMAPSSPPGPADAIEPAERPATLPGSGAVP